MNIFNYMKHEFYSRIENFKLKHKIKKLKHSIRNNVYNSRGFWFFYRSIFGFIFPKFGNDINIIKKHGNIIITFKLENFRTKEIRKFKIQYTLEEFKATSNKIILRKLDIPKF